MLTTFDRHLLSRFLYVFVVAYVSTFGLFVVIDGFSNVDAFQEHAADSWEILQGMAGYYGWQSFLFFEMVGGILVVISSMVVLAMLLKQNELHPLLAAGVPTFRLILPFVLGGAAVNALLIANREIVIPRIAYRLLQPRGRDAKAVHSVEPVYDHATHVYINGSQLVLAERRLIDPDFALPAPQIVGELTTIAAREAVFSRATAERPAGWTLIDARPRYEEIPVTEQGRSTIRPGDDPANVFVVSDVTCDQLSPSTHNTRLLGSRELVRRINNPSLSEWSVRGQILRLHTRLTEPLVNLAALVILLPLVLRRESRSLIGNLAVCSAVMGLLLGVTYAFEYVGGTNLLRPDMAAWGPVIVNGTLAAWLSGLAQT